MGYDVRFRLVRPYDKPRPEYKRSTVPVIEGEGENAYVYHEILKGKDDKFLTTNRKEVMLDVAAMLDLCCIGSGPLSALVQRSKNKEANKLVYRYYASNGNSTHSEDGYGDHFKPVSLNLVIKALEAECKVLDYAQGTKPYHRFVWALGLLNAFKDRGEDYMVLFEGH